jgi:hypothetical protein
VQGPGASAAFVSPKALVASYSSKADHGLSDVFLDQLAERAARAAQRSGAANDGGAFQAVQRFKSMAASRRLAPRSASSRALSPRAGGGAEARRADGGAGSGARPITVGRSGWAKLRQSASLRSMLREANAVPAEQGNDRDAPAAVASPRQDAMWLPVFPGMHATPRGAGSGSPRERVPSPVPWDSHNPLQPPQPAPDPETPRS